MTGVTGVTGVTGAVALPVVTDRIVLQGVSAFGHHGVLDVEKRDGQTFVVDVVMTLDLSRAGRSDSLEATVSYAEIAGEVMQRITGPSFDLIERLAEVIADDVLMHDLVDRVEVVVHKPQAPVGHPFTDVQVVVQRDNAAQVVIALGSNLGDRGETLAAASASLQGLAGLTVTRMSSVVESDPVGGPEQPCYLNAVVIGRCSMPPAALLDAMHGIEHHLGRTREVRWGARTLDLDLISYGRPGGRHEVVSDDPNLTLPHPRAGERAFVLVPWHEVDAGAGLRVTGGAQDADNAEDAADAGGTDGVRPVAELIAGLDCSGVRPTAPTESSDS